MQNPRGEWMIGIPLLHSIDDKGIHTYRHNPDAIDWLKSFLGPPETRLATDVSEAFLWRHRLWKFGQNGVWAYFFYHKHHALLFAVRWGGKVL